MKLEARKNGFGNISEQELKNIQSSLLSLLLEFDEICRKYDIKYYLDGGSALGALRHGGFIPWDDDIDLLMKRSEFNKLLNIIDSEIELRKNRLFAYMGRKQHFHHPFARYVNTEIPHIVRQPFMEANYPLGIFIDVFILDPVPSGKLKEYQKKLEIYEEWFHKGLNGVVGLMPFWKYCCFGIWEKYSGENAVFEYIDKQLSQYEDCEADFYVPRNGFNYAVYDADVFQEPKYLNFEGHLLPVPTMPEKFVRTHYSIDWFLLPPIEKRISHHLTLTSDEFKLQEFTDYYNWYKDIPEIHRIQYKRHKYQILRKKKLENTRKIMANLQGKCEQIAINKYLKQIDESELTKLESKGEYLVIIEKLQPYIQTQLRDVFRQYGVKIVIPQSYLRLALISLLKVGRFYDADRILSLYNENESWLAEIREKINLAKQAETAEQDNPEAHKPIFKGIPAVVDEKDLPKEDNSVLDVQLELLDEIDSLCSSHGIDYTLTGNALIDAIRYGYTSGSYSNIKIAMTADNFKKFIALENELPNNRKIESIFNNQYFPNRTAHYVNADTTSFQITAPWYKFPGIYIEVKLIRPKLSKKSYKKEKILRRVLKVAFIGPKFCRPIIAPFVKFHKKNLLNLFEYPSDIFKMRILNKPKILTLSLYKDELNSYEKIHLNGKTYSVLSSVVKNIIHNYPWIHGIELKDFLPDNVQVVHTNVEYQQFIDNLPKKNLFNYYKNRIPERLALLGIKNVEKSKFCHKKILFTVAYNFYRFKLYKQYMPQLDNLVKLLSEKQFDKIEIVLKDYIENFNYFFQFNKILVFNPMIFSIYLEFLKYQHKTDFADYLSKKVKSTEYISASDLYLASNINRVSKMKVH